MGVSLPAWLSTEGQALTVAVLACILAWLFVPVLLNCYRTISRRIKLQPVPLAPGCLPFLGHAADLLGHQFPWEVLLGYCNTLQRDVVRWALPWQDWVIIRGGRHMKLVLQTNFKHYDKEMAMSFHPFVCILGTGLVTSHGDLWHKQRRLMTPAFKQEILDHVITISLRAVTRLNSKLDAARSTQSVIEIEEEFRLLTLQVITEAMMSLSYEESDRVFPRLYLPIMEECHKRVFAPWREFLPMLPAYWRHRSNNRQLDTYLCAHIRGRWDALATADAAAMLPPVEERDMLDVILIGKRKAGEAWTAALQRQLCFEMKTFLLAGHETSASMLTFTLVEVLHQPELCAQVVAEADRVLGPHGSRIPTRAEVETMVVSEACLRETLRRYTPVPVVTRIANQDTQIGEYAIPAGTKVTLHLQGTHEQWADPHEYRPARFLPGGEFEAFPPDVRRFMFLPFGEGPRVCIGQHFSLMESRVVLAALLQRYRFDMQRPRAIDFVPNIIPLQPLGGVPVLVK